MTAADITLHFCLRFGKIKIDGRTINYTYDNGKLKTSQWQYYSNSKWNLGTLDTYTYTPDGKVETLVIQSGATGTWKPSQKEIHSFENGYETNWLMQNWNNVWVDFSQINYTNDSKGNVLTSVYQNYQNSKWNDYSQSVFTYDANGNELTGYNSQWLTNQWKPADASFDVKINGNDYYFTGYFINLKYILVNTTGIAADNNSLVNGYSLSQNYPNPFNPSTKISYSLPSDSRVTLEVYNITGKRISQLVNQEQPAGNYSVDFGSSKLSSGIYFYRITAVNKANGNNFLAIKKMILLK